jgi:hypothetical protein
MSPGVTEVTLTVVPLGCLMVVVVVGISARVCRYAHPAAMQPDVRARAGGRGGLRAVKHPDHGQMVPINTRAYSCTTPPRRACDRPIKKESIEQNFLLCALAGPSPISMQHAHVARSSRQVDRHHCVHTSVSLAPRVPVRASGMWRGLLCGTGAALMCSLSRTVSRYVTLFINGSRANSSRGLSS